MVLERGALLNNRYRIVEILGQGGMGSVYRAVDENLGVEVAVKDNLFTTEEYARQFRREAIILATLRHPNMPRVTDHFVIEGQGQYLVMDYIDGEDLRQRMDRVETISEEEAIVIGAAICDALTYLSTRNPSIVHRDIKPGNVKITPQGQIFLVDFGLAKVLQGSQATTTGARAMTPGYSPPEQYGTARTDHRSDLFSLGATLYAALTGSIPEDALARTMDQCNLTPIRKHNPRVSRRLASIIEKSLEVRPDDRYQTADEFKQALLSVRNNIRRKTGEYTITPPPQSIEKPISTEGMLPPEIASEVEAVKPSGNGRSPLLVSSALMDEADDYVEALPRKKARLRGCLMLVVLVGVLLLSGLGAAYAFDPRIPSQALALAWPAWAAPGFAYSPLTQTSTLVPTDTLVPTFTPTLMTPIGVVANPLTSTPTATLEPTATENPTQTPEPQPTPYGGGSGQIAFASDVNGVVEIYVMNIDGTGLQQVTNLEEGACQPNWSPDGQRLVFISPCDGNQEYYQDSALYIINVDGSNMNPLSTTPGGDFDPDWSPDGNKIVFTSTRKGGRPQIYVMDLRTKETTILSDEYSRDWQPVWSPDGTKIAFITNRKGPYQVWIMDADGKNQELFSHSINGNDTHPAWSPDGKLLLFTQIESQGDIPRLVVAPLEDAGMREYKLNRDPIPMREGRYSPDGFWIAFESWPKGANHDIYIMTANGAGRRQLTTQPRDDFDPAWRPVVATSNP
jgi:Tol biopolymer transport system component/serine/threonine protein kinase